MIFSSMCGEREQRNFISFYSVPHQDSTFRHGPSKNNGEAAFCPLKRRCSCPQIRSSNQICIKTLISSFNKQAIPHQTPGTPGVRSAGYAPSLPNSAVQSEFLFKSSPETVGLEALIARMKSFTTSGGSSSFSESTSTHVISIAPASPGEQGVSFSSPSTIT